MKKLRLEGITKLADEYPTVADIGTDHGIVPHELVKSAKARRVIALDISEKSLDKLGEKLDYLDKSERTVLNMSDGLDSLNEYQVDTIIISSTEGNLIADILNKSLDIAKSANCLVLGANNSLALSRRFLHENSFEITEEVGLSENDKYYQIIKAKAGKQLLVNEYKYEFGKYLIGNKSEYLKRYIDQQIENKNNVLSNLSDKNSDSAKSATENINVEVNELEKVLDKVET